VEPTPPPVMPFPRRRFRPTNRPLLWSLPWLILALLQCLPVAAERVDPFTVVVPVTDQGDRAREAGARAGLRQVLIRVSGDAERVDQALSQSFRRPAEQQIRYVEMPPAEAGGAPRQGLELVFEEHSVMRLVRDLGLPIWPLERPGTTAWIALDDGYGRELLGTRPEHEPLRMTLADAAAARGLPLVVPLMDLEDRARIDASDVWAGFIDPIREAANRYGTPAVLIGRAARGGTGWVARWRLVDGQWSENWQGEGNSLETLLASGVDAAADRIVQRSAVMSFATDASLLIRVRGVDSMREYARVLEHLQALSLVDAVDPVSVSPGVLEIALGTSAGGDAVAEALALEGVIERDDTVGRRSGERVLDFRLVR